MTNNVPKPKEAAEHKTSKLPEDSRGKVPTGLLAGISGGAWLGNKALVRHMLKSMRPGVMVNPQAAEVNKSLFEGAPSKVWGDKGLSKPEWRKTDQVYGGRAGPYFIDETQRIQDFSSKDRIGDFFTTREVKPHVYVPEGVHPEIMAHELGHSLQSKDSIALRKLTGKAVVSGGLLNSIASLLYYKAHDDHPEVSDAGVYASGALGALSSGALLGSEIGASAKGYSLMKRVGLKPSARRIFTPNASYALTGLALQGVPMTLAVKRFLDNRKAKALDADIPSKEASDEPSLLDKALNLVKGYQDHKKEVRDNIMENILPDVLQPQEPKTAEVKEEVPKSFHGKKYDRRMKFNTALERSEHKTTDSTPEWLKEAADGSFDCSGVTGRESVINVENELNRTPPLPTEEPYWYDVPNKPVMQKESKEFDLGAFLRENWTKNQEKQRVAEAAMGESKFLRNMRIGIPVLGAAGVLGLGGYGLYKATRQRYGQPEAEIQKGAAEIPPSILEGAERTLSRPHVTPSAARLIVQEAIEQGSMAMGRKKNKALEAAKQANEESFTQRHPAVLPIALGLGGAVAGAVPGALLGGRAAVRSAEKVYARNVEEALNNLNAHVATKDKFVYPGNTAAEAKSFARDRFKLDEAHRKAVESVPTKSLHQGYGRFGGGLLGGLTGGSLGALGGEALNEPMFSTASKQAADEGSFTQRHPYAIPIAATLGGAALGAVGGRQLSKRWAKVAPAKTTSKNRSTRSPKKTPSSPEVVDAMRDVASMSGSAPKTVSAVAPKPSPAVAPKSTSKPTPQSGSDSSVIRTPEEAGKFFGQEITPTPAPFRSEPSITKQEIQGMAQQAAAKSKMELEKTVAGTPSPSMPKVLSKDKTQSSPRRAPREGVNLSDYLPQMTML